MPLSSRIEIFDFERGSNLCIVGVCGHPAGLDIFR